MTLTQMKHAAMGLACVLIAVPLAGCSEPAPEPTATFSTSTPSPTPVASPSPTVTDEGITVAPEAPFEAVVTLASLDVDGTLVTIAGYVQGIVEEGGACTFTLTPTIDGNPVTAESVGIDNVSTTSCGSIDLDANQFSRGTWAVTLAYVSLEGLSTTSAPYNLEMP